MESLNEVKKSLELIYYEYDKNKNSFIVSNDASKDESFNELIKITYNLSKEEIEFFVDKNKNIIISKNKGLYFKLQRSFDSFIQKAKKQKMNIYLLGSKKIPHAKNIELFDIEPIEQEVDIKGYDKIIFTSKNAITSIDKLDKSWRTKESYVIAPQTAKAAKRLKANVKFIGKSHHGDEFAKELSNQLLPNEKVLYIRASKVVSNLVEILKSHNIICDELVVYKTVCKKLKKKQKFPDDSTFIFSSPSSIECFFKNYKWKDTYKAISIGHTTQKYFPKGIESVLADTTSLDSCVRKAVEINS